MTKRLISIIVLSVVCLVIVANLVLFTITQDGFTGNDWIHINIYNESVFARSNYKFVGLTEIFSYLETFPGLSNSLTTINMVARTVSGQFNVTDYTVVNAILGVLFVLWSPVQLIFTFVIDILNDVIWVIGFFLPKAFN